MRAEEASFLEICLESVRDIVQMQEMKDDAGGERR